MFGYTPCTAAWAAGHQELADGQVTHLLEPGEVALVILLLVLEARSLLGLCLALLPRLLARCAAGRCRGRLRLRLHLLLGFRVRVRVGTCLLLLRD
jgi:hypothetical protein